MVGVCRTARDAALICCVLLFPLFARAEDLLPGTRLCPLAAHKKLFDLSMDLKAHARPESPEEAHNQKLTESFARIQSAECIFIEAHTAVTLTGKKTTTYDEFSEVDFKGRKLWVSSIELGH
jgi:hypothetical protein